MNVARGGTTVFALMCQLGRQRVKTSFSYAVTQTNDRFSHSFPVRLLRALPSAFALAPSAEGYTRRNAAAASLEHEGGRMCVIAYECLWSLLAALLIVVRK